jgi:hypothetical protein
VYGDHAPAATTPWHRDGFGNHVVVFIVVVEVLCGRFLESLLLLLLAELLGSLLLGGWAAGTF